MKKRKKRQWAEGRVLFSREGTQGMQRRPAQDSSHTWFGFRLEAAAEGKRLVCVCECVYEITKKEQCVCVCVPGKHLCAHLQMSVHQAAGRHAC